MAQAQQKYISLLIELDKAVLQGNINKLKKSAQSLQQITNAEDQVTFSEYYQSDCNPLRRTNLIILACKYNRLPVLDYLLGSGNKILTHLNKTTILPNDEDATFHNAFYYALRSGNVNLLDVLIKRWPDNYFTFRSEELDEILSGAYEELNLKNVALTEEMSLFVENQLITLRLLNRSEEGSNVNQGGDYLNNIIKRIQLVLENISLLNEKYTNMEEINDTFLFILKFVATNIHILKRQMKSTYIRLPWEEIEFCLLSFILTRTKRQEINLFYHVTLDKDKILTHLKCFAEQLEAEQKNIMNMMDHCKLTDTIPPVKRELVVAKIISICPQFESLYQDHQQIRDIHSLEKMSDHIKLALLANVKERKGQLTIIRVLQVIGEHVKNTLESPKLSNTTNELLLLTLPINVRKIIIDLRTSLSHAYALGRRTDIEQAEDVQFYIGIQEDIQKIGNVITGILYDCKFKLIQMLLKKLIDSENLTIVQDIAKLLQNVDTSPETLKHFEMKHERLENLVQKLSDSIDDQTSYEKELFYQINDAISFEKNKILNKRIKYIMGLSLLQTLVSHNEFINTLKGIQNDANKILMSITESVEFYSVQKIVKLSMKIVDSVKSRKSEDDSLDELNRLSFEMLYSAGFYGNDNIKWIEELRDKLVPKSTFTPEHKHNYPLTESKSSKQLNLKLSDLKRILSDNMCRQSFAENFAIFQSNRTLQAAVEMLVLDIMSILATNKTFVENNILFLDQSSPLLTGKCLRNHMAHGNALVDVILSDPLKSIIINANILCSKELLKIKEKPGQLHRAADISKLKDKFTHNLDILCVQRRMFQALTEENLQELKSCIQRGADIHARNIVNRWSTLHYAAKGSSLDIVKFILDQKVDPNGKDVANQSPMHIAATYGRTSIVKFLIEDVGLPVDVKEDEDRTPLHIAASKGHKSVVEVLIKNNAQANCSDCKGFSPLHCAIQNNHKDIADFMLKTCENIDINQVLLGTTSLHSAAERGHLDIVNFLLQHGAQLNAKNDKEGIPLHNAAMNGRLDVVSALITRGSNINARTIDGCTPLQFAVENGHLETAKYLIEHGATVNTIEKIYNNSPLHFAANEGNEHLVRILLENKAKGGVATVTGLTPLHLAVRCGHLGAVAALLEYGVDVNAKDQTNATPLHFAVESGREKVAKLLMEYNAQIDVQDKLGITPLHVAAQKGYEGFVALLIQNKANINGQTCTGSTPLHNAAVNGNTNVIDLLIKNKAEVNAKCHKGSTPLHVAALNGQIGAVNCLIQNKAEVNGKIESGITPLHLACVSDAKDVVNLLIKHKAQVNAFAMTDCTPLQIAVQSGNKDIVQLLLENGAKVNGMSNSTETPLSIAIKGNRKEIVELLISYGACVNDARDPLSLAIMLGFKDIVDILIKNKARINNVSDVGLHSPLHVAALRGHKEIVKALISKGADVNATSKMGSLDGLTPLHLATEKGYLDIVNILIKNGANINVKFDGTTPLHLAVGELGNSDIAEILLNNGAIINIKDAKNRRPLELAVANNNLKTVKALILKGSKNDINAKANDDWTLLHIAADNGNLEMVKYLINEGADIHARNASNSKPVHIAAREGFKDIVDFFLNNGVRINETGAASQTLLHYAAMKGHEEMVKYLISENADVNIQDVNGLSPMHFAANFGFKTVCEILLKNGALYNIIDKQNRKPLDMARDKLVIKLLLLTELLFKAVRYNKCSDVENCIQNGAFIDSRNSNDVTPLHYATWKGYSNVVEILVKNNANPNLKIKDGCTPLHYAAKYSHFDIVKILLLSGAIYNVKNARQETPLDLSAHQGTINLLKLVSESFKKVYNGNVKVINEIKRLKDVDTLKVVMNARNTENRTLVVVAMHNNFPKVKELKELLQDDVSSQVYFAIVLAMQEKFQQALKILNEVLVKRREILGPDNPGTLDIQNKIAEILYKQQRYQDAMNIFNEIYEKRKQVLGVDHADTLDTRSSIALILHRQGKNTEALNILREVYQKQKEILGDSHLNILSTQMHIALVLNSQGSYDEALAINTEVFNKQKNLLGVYNPATLSTQNNIAMVLSNQKKFDQALEVYQEVYEVRLLVLGPDHSDTLRALHNKASVFLMQQKFNEALGAFNQVYKAQKTALGYNHIDTVSTHYNIGNVLFLQGKNLTALKYFKENIELIKASFGENHFKITQILQQIKLINFKLKIEGNENLENTLQNFQRKLNTAAGSGDMDTVLNLLNNGADINDRDINGRSPLHYAANNGHTDIVDILLKNAADPTQATYKGNTPLHTAVAGGFDKTVEVLLHHIGRDKLKHFIDAKTTTSGATSLHVAAKGGFLEIVKILLKYSAAYNIENKEGKMPLDLTTDTRIYNLLMLVDKLFKAAKDDIASAVDELKTMQSDEIVAVTNARSRQGATLLQVSILYQSKRYTVQLLQILKTSSQIAGNKENNLNKS